MKRMIQIAIVHVGISSLLFAACATGSQHVEEAPKQSSRDRMKGNADQAYDDLDVAHGDKKREQSGGAPAAAPGAAPAAAPAQPGSTGSGSSAGLTTPTGAAPAPAAARPARAGGGENGSVTAQALVGHWKAGKLQIVFGADGSYTWIQARACRKKPCAADTTSGTFKIRRDKLYLSPGEGNDLALGARFSAGMLLLTSKADGKEWTLSRR